MPGRDFHFHQRCVQLERFLHGQRQDFHLHVFPYSYEEADRQKYEAFLIYIIAHIAEQGVRISFTHPYTKKIFTLPPVHIVLSIKKVSLVRSKPILINTFYCLPEDTMTCKSNTKSPKKIFRNGIKPIKKEYISPKNRNIGL